MISQRGLEGFVVGPSKESIRPFFSFLELFARVKQGFAVRHILLLSCHHLKQYEWYLGPKTLLFGSVDPEGDSC